MSHEADEDAEFMQDFGQKVDLCQRIRDVTTNYPEGSLLKAREFAPRLQAALSHRLVCPCLPALSRSPACAL